MPSKLDPFTDDIIQWRVEGKTYRDIAALIKGKGVDVSFAAVGVWWRSQIGLVTTQQQKAATQFRATRTVIETEWAEQMHEWKGNYDAAKEAGAHAEKMFLECASADDEAGMERWDNERRSAGPAMAVWARLYHDAWKAMMSKLIPSPTPVSLSDESVERMSVEEFRKMILEG